MGRERFWATAVEIDSCYVVLNGEGCFYGELRGGGTELKDEVGFFDGVGPEDGDGGADVVDDASSFCDHKRTRKKGRR